MITSGTQRTTEPFQAPRSIFSRAALAMKAERVSPCSRAASSMALSVPASSETLAFTERPLSKITTLGSELVFYDPLNVMSYAMARLKSNSIGPGAAYRNKDYRPIKQRIWHGRDITSWRQYDISSDQIFREMLAPGGHHHKHVVEGGAWWRHTEIRKAQAHGDGETVARLQAEMDAGLAAIVSGINSMQ